MEKYEVKMLPKAHRDLDDIFDYIANELIEPKIAEGMFSSIEDAILGLDKFPYRGADRKVGIYANKGYRQLFVKNFTIIYRVDEVLRQVIVVTVRYSPSHF